MSEQRNAGLAALQQGNIQVAIPLLEEACRTDSSDFHALQYLGMAYQQGGRTQEAVQTLTTAVNLKPADAQARYNLAVAMESAGYPNEAQQVYTQALQLQPNYPMASQALARLSGSAPAPIAVPAYAPLNQQPASAPTYAPLNQEQPSASPYAPVNPSQPQYQPQSTPPAYTPLTQQGTGIPLTAPRTEPTTYAPPPQAGYAQAAPPPYQPQLAYGAPVGPARPTGVYAAPSGPSCQECGSQESVRYVHYRQNIGALYMRFSKEHSGEMCEGCATKHFWQMTLTTFFLGAFGVISFFLSPFFILSNIASYVKGAKPVGRIMAVAFALLYVTVVGGIVYAVATSKSSEQEGPRSSYQRN